MKGIERLKPRLVVVYSNEFNEESKYTRGHDNILFTYEYKVKGKFNGRSYKSDKEYQIQVSTSHDNYNMKQNLHILFLS